MTISKKALAIVLSGLFVLAGAAYFTFLSPKPTRASFTLARAYITPTVNESVHGVISPAEDGRLVTIEVATVTGWREVARTSTDSSGTFSLTFPLTKLGSNRVRVRIPSRGRHQALTAAVAKPVLVLEPTELDAQIPRFARADEALQISGRVTPPSNRTVHLETSTDGQSWTSLGTSKTSATTGQFSVAAGALRAGTVHVRLTVDRSDTAASAVTRPKSLSVEDYRAAGRRYLAIVAHYNELVDQYDALGDTDFAGFKALTPKLSQAASVQSRAFRAYAYWPREVRHYISLLIQEDILDADYWNLVAHADDFAEANSISLPKLPQGAENAAALTRDALGLPKRD